jgi:hypothetical protein
LPPGRKIRAAKRHCIFKIKPGSNDDAPRYNSRMVEKGFTQWHGVYFKGTYAPVQKTKLTKIRSVSSRSTQPIKYTTTSHESLTSRLVSQNLVPSE